MFGLDDDIRTFVQSWIQWFTTPPLNSGEEDAEAEGEEDGTGSTDAVDEAAEE